MGTYEISYSTHKGNDGEVEYYTLIADKKLTVGRAIKTGRDSFDFTAFWEGGEDIKAETMLQLKIKVEKALPRNITELKEKLLKGHKNRQNPPTS